MKAIFTALFAALVLSFVGSQAQALSWGDPCQGQIQGTWFYKDGRPMTLTVQRTGGNQVNVSVTTKAGTELTAGRCDARSDGSAWISFRGYNFGRVYVYPNGFVNGSVSNYQFQGQMY